MKRIAFVIYRRWAHAIFQQLLDFQKQRPGFEVSALLTTASAEFSAPERDGAPKTYVVEPNDHVRIAAILADHAVDAVCFYGWSWLVKEPLLSRHVCLCLHPSPLPRYRGGSPIQNQVIAGEVASSVTVFRMQEGMDDGDVYRQLPMSLEGSLDEIFARIVDLGIVITRQFVADLENDEVRFVPQEGLDAHPPHRRRTAKQSQIEFEELPRLTYVELDNRVRSLADPYPNAYLAVAGGRIRLQALQKYRAIPSGSVVLDDVRSREPLDDSRPLVLRVSDGYALLTKHRLEREG